jgi:hypothetical protein
MLRATEARPIDLDPGQCTIPVREKGDTPDRSR